MEVIGYFSSSSKNKTLINKECSPGFADSICNASINQGNRGTIMPDHKNPFYESVNEANKSSLEDNRLKINFLQEKKISWVKFLVNSWVTSGLRYLITILASKYFAQRRGKLYQENSFSGGCSAKTCLGLWIGTGKMDYWPDSAFFCLVK